MRPARKVAHAVNVLALAGLVACGPSAAPQTVLELSPVKMTPSAPRSPRVVVAGAMPGDVDLYAELGAPHALFDTASKDLGAAVAAPARAAIARSLGVPEDIATRLIDAATSVHFGGQRIDGKLELVTSVLFGDPQPMRDALAQGAFTDDASSSGGRRLKLKNDASTLAWFEAERLLVIARDDRMIDRVAAVLAGSAPALPDATRGAPLAGVPFARVFVAPALLNTLTEGERAFLEPLTIAYDADRGSLRGAYKVALAVPKGDLSPMPPRALALARSLPSETIAYAALSTTFADGIDGVRRLLAAAGKSGRDADRTLMQIDGALTLVGASLSELVGALGKEGTMGIALPGGSLAADVPKRFAIVWLQEVAAPKPFENVIQAAPSKLKLLSGRAKITTEPRGFAVELAGAQIPYARVRLERGKLIVAVGDKELVDHAVAASETGKGTLADDPAHDRAMSALPKPSQLRVWVDAARVFELASSLPDTRRSAPGLGVALPQGPSRLTSAFTLSTTQEASRAHLELDEIDGLGAFAPLAIFGVRRYLAAAKTAEARNTLGAIARGAGVSYEIEHVDPKALAGAVVTRQVCRSAKSVPEVVPRATKHQPTASDWSTGDERSGWRCLRFEMSMPHYYRYSYVAGGPYKGPARGGPDPGPDGFEAAAEGDLDGDGVTSLFTITGKIDPATKALVISPIFVDRELE